MIGKSMFLVQYFPLSNLLICKVVGYVIYGIFNIKKDEGKLISFEYLSQKIPSGTYPSLGGMIT